MQITIRQRGGFAGIDTTLIDLDTTQLAPDVRARVEQQVRDSGVLLSSPQQPPGADLFEYEVVLQTGGRRHVYSCRDDGGPIAAPVRDLIGQLREII